MTAFCESDVTAEKEKEILEVEIIVVKKVSRILPRAGSSSLGLGNRAGSNLRGSRKIVRLAWWLEIEIEMEILISVFLVTIIKDTHLALSNEQASGIMIH